MEIRVRSSRRPLLLLALLPTLASCLDLALPACGQISPGPEDSGPVVAYVPDFYQSQPIPEIGDLGAFASSLVRLELLTNPAIDTRHDFPPLACSAMSQNQVARAEQRSAAVTTGEITPRPLTLPAVYYVVCGKLEVRQQESEIKIDYAVEKWSRGERTLLFQETQPFFPEQALEQIKIASHTIAFRIQAAVPRTRVKIAPFAFGGENDQQELIAQSLKTAVTDKLAEARDLVLTQDAPYEVRGRLSFLPGRFLKVEMTISVRGEDHPLEPVSGSSDSLNEVYAKAAEETLAGLNAVRLAERPGWKEFFASGEAHEWAVRGRQLLCIPATETCTQDIPAAVSVLRTANSKYPNDTDVSYLLGYAQFLSGDTLSAANTLRATSKQLRSLPNGAPPAKLIEVSNTLGDVYRYSGSYSDAVNEYNESLREDPSQILTIIRKAEALRFAGKRVDALEASLKGLALPATPEQKDLHASTQDLIRGLQPEDLDASLALLKQSFASGAPVADEYALALLTQGYAVSSDPRSSWKQALELNPADPEIQLEINGAFASWDLNHADPAGAEPYLKRAEELSKEAVLSPEMEAWVLRLRSIYFLDTGKYQESYAYAQNAVRRDPTPSEKSVLAEVTYFWARNLESATSSADSQTSAKQRAENARRLYRESVALSTPLVDARYTFADWYYLQANHFLQLDRETVQKFKHIVKDNPTDDFALQQLMFVCTEYLFDRDCAVSSALQYMQNQGSAGPSDIGTLLDCVEIAVLNGADKQASDWLALASQRAGIPPNRSPIINLYKYWVALLHKDNLSAQQAFSAWSRGTIAFREWKGDLDWEFNGAKHALKAAPLDDRQKTLLLRMIGCLQDSSLPLPESPNSVALAL